VKVKQISVTLRYSRNWLSHTAFTIGFTVFWWLFPLNCVLLSLKKKWTDQALNIRFCRKAEDFVFKVVFQVKGA
jgi:hypothetical protein